MVGPFTIDRFATNHNKVLTKYNSMVYEQDCSGVDAFAQTDYAGHTNFIHPPYTIMGRTTSFLQTLPTTTRFAVVFPLWETQPWFLTLVNLCDVVFVLPLKGKNLYTKIGNIPGRDYIKNAEWKFAVGIKNLGLKQNTDWKLFK